MTTETTTSDSTTPAETEEQKPTIEQRLAQMDDMILTNLFERLQSHASALKDAQTRLAAADPEKAITEYVKTSDDPQLVKIREQIEKLTAKAREIASEKVGGTLSDEEKTTLETVREVNATGVAKCRKSIIMFSEDSPFKETVAEMLNEVISGVKGARASSGAGGSTLPRANVILTVARGDQAWEFGSFSEAKNTLKFDIESLGRAFAAAAGVPYEEISSVDKPQNFTFKHGDLDYEVSTRPKPVLPRGRKKNAA